MHYQSKRILIILHIFFWINFSGNSEGWKELSPYGANVYINIQKPWWGIADPACLDENKIHIHIANPGEKIYYGFNVYVPQPPNMNPVTYVRILRPNGTVAKLDTIRYNSIGWMTNYAQAAAGPNVINPAGYSGFDFTPLAPGDYMMDFGYPDPIVYGSDLNFDITVVDTTLTTWKSVPGRVYSKSWSLQPSSGGFYGTLYSYPNDSIVTSVFFNGAMTIGMFLVMNRNGILAPPANWIISRMSQFHVQGNLWGGVPDFKIFLNNPDQAVYPTGVLGEIVPGSLTLYPNCNGTADITYTTTKAGHVELQIQIDPDPSIQPVDIMISDSVVTGLNTYTWDGLNGLGQVVQNGTPCYINIKYLNGLTNIPFNFSSGTPNGFIVQLHRPSGPTPLMCWDDRNIDPTNYNFTGCVSSLPATGCHSWPNAPPYSLWDIINTWWYASAMDIASSAVLFKRSFSDTTAMTICANDTVIFHGQPVFNPGITTVNFPSVLTGCDSSYSLNLVQIPGPAVHLGNDTTICTGQSITFDAGACSGCTYQWANLTTGQPNIGTGQTYNATTAGFYMATVTGTNGCEGRDTVVLSTGQPVTIGVSISTTVNPVCAGTVVTFTATPVNPGTAPTYQWKVNGVNAINGNNAVFSCSPLNGDVVTCELTSSLSSCLSANPVTSNVITMGVNPTLPVSVAVSPSMNPVCAGTPVNFTAVPVNGGTTPVYQWKINAVNAINGNNAVYTYTPVNGDLVSCELTSSEVCTSGNPASSIPYQMIVNQTLPVGVTIAASSNPFCAGSSVTFTATPVNGGAIPAYQWKVNAVNAINGNNAVFSYTPVNGDIVTCVLSSSDVCTSGNPASSVAIQMVVNANLPAGITIASSSNPFCEGTIVNYTANPANGGSTPLYQWKVNGINAINGNNAVFNYSPLQGDVISCEMTSNLNCVTQNPAISNTIVMAVSVKPTVTFTPCNDVITTLSSQPFILKGGIPFGGVYSGPGVNSLTGVFTPSAAGTGVKTIKYTYTNVVTCSDFRMITITVQPIPSFTCGNLMTDVRDGHLYRTFLLANGKCWMEENLEFGFTISDLLPQTDNCIAEKYQSTVANRTSSFYQWDELMQYNTSAGSQGLCPPGWHIPTSAEWEELIINFNGPGQAGGPMKDTLVSGIKSHQSGFFYLNNTWAFTSGIDAGSMYWTSTATAYDRAVARGLNEYNPSVSRYFSSRGNSFGVRCMKD